MFHIDRQCSLQKGLFPSISKVLSLYRSRLCHERITQGSMWESLEGTLASSKADTSRVLLAYYAVGHPVLHESVWQVPALQQHHMIAISRTNNNKRPLAVRPVGIGHSRTYPYGNMTAQVPYPRDRLLHQMGQGRTIGYYHEEKCPKLHLEKYHLPL